jgi:hypothetical protein
MLLIERLERREVSMKKENKLCDNGYMICFNIYGVLLIFKMYFNEGFKV